MGVTVQHLEYFCAVARNRSFSAAARELYTSQPHVSNQIRKLEARFGVQLFLRTVPRISLTPAGQALLAEASDLLDRIAGLDHLIASYRSLDKGAIYLAAVTTAGNHALPGVLADFHRDYPGIALNLRVGNTEQVLHWLDLDETDFAVQVKVAEREGFASIPVFVEELNLIVPADFDAAATVTVEEFAAMPKVIREPGSASREEMLRLLAPYPGASAVVAQLEGATAVNEAVASGLGVSVVPMRAARPWLDAGSVRLVKMHGVSIRLPVYVMYAENRSLSPAARAFIDYLDAIRASDTDSSAV